MRVTVAIVAMLLVLPGTARADLHSIAPAGLPHISLVPVASAQTLEQRSAGTPRPFFGAADLSGPLFECVGVEAVRRPPLPEAVPFSGHAEQVEQLPPPPGGDLLCLSGVLSIGVWNALRKARHGHFALPEWYDQWAPSQIRHVSLSEWTSSPLVVCLLADLCPAETADNSLFFSRSSDAYQALRNLHVVPVAKPRGPPLSFRSM